MADVKWKRIGPGHYKSADGAFEIKREKSMQTGRRIEIVWEIINCTLNQTLPYCEDTLADAKAVVKRYY